MRKIQRDELTAQLAAVNDILQSLPEDDYLGRTGFEERQYQITERLDQLEVAPQHRAQVALFFGGDPVIGSMGIQAEFSTDILGTFQDLITKVWGTLDGAAVRQMGPIKDKDASQLHITTVVHGSFGFVLEELKGMVEPLFQSSLSKAADEVTEYIVGFTAENETRFSELIEELNPRVFHSIRDFFAHMYKSNATFRMVEGERDEQFDRFAVERAWKRAVASDVIEDEIRVEGTLLGVTPISRRFEFASDETGAVIYGKVGEKFSNTYLEKIKTQDYSGKRWRALLYKRTVTRVGRAPKDHYTLLNLEELSKQQG